MMPEQPDILDQLFAGLPEPFLADRSLLERYCRCPYQGASVETGAVQDGSRAADSGTEAHNAMGGIVEAFVAGEHQARALADIGLGIARSSRPDVQPDVLEAVGRSLYRFSADLVYLPGGDGVLRNPADVLRHQGGEGERTGQLAVDLIESTYDRPGLRVTSELDLLTAGPAENVLCETDWKTGHKDYSPTDIRQAFQFRLHAWLVFRNYPDCVALLVRVWTTRTGWPTDWVRFNRRDADDIEAQLHSIDRERRAALDALAVGEQPKCRPYAENCVPCPAAIDCPLAHRDSARLNEDPEAFLAETAAVKAAYEQRVELLRQYVREHGELRGGGLVCGEKPPARRKPSITLYEAKDTDG